MNIINCAIYFCAWLHVTCCLHWGKCGKGYRSGGGVILAIFKATVNTRIQPHVPASLPLGNNPIEYIFGLLVDVTAVCETTVAHNPPHVLGIIATARLVHVDLPKLHFAPLQLQFLSYQHSFDVSDRLCVLAVRVHGYRYRGLGFDSRHYQIFWVVVGLERGPLRLVRSIEELLE